MFFGTFSSALVFPFFDVFCVPEWGATDFPTGGGVRLSWEYLIQVAIPMWQ